MDRSRNHAGPRPLAAKAFIFRNYIGLFVATALFSFALVTILMVYQVRTLNKVYIEKSADVVRLHRNELLNEIALSDFSSLTQHLNYMLNEMNADRVVLLYEGKRYESAARIGAASPRIVAALSKVGGISPFRIDIANEFGTFRAVVEVTYAQALYTWILSPVFLSLFIIAGLIWIPVTVVFVMIFRRIRNIFIDPLNAVTASLLQRGADEPALTNVVVEEIAQLQRACEQFRLTEADAAFAKIARQVTHDIRSPLAALDTLLSLIQDLPEEQRVLLRTAVSRIRDVSNHLLAKTRPAGVPSSAPRTKGEGAKQAEYLWSLVEAVVSEKRQQHSTRPGIEIRFAPDPSCYSYFVQADPERLKRALSNLLDNAIEAMDASGRVEVSLRRDASRMEVVIHDDGRGIPAAVLPTLMERGQTHGKPGGSGLGLAFARECAAEWGGELRLESVEGRGTTVTLRLQSAEPPAWFVRAIQAPSGASLVVIDDDPSIHGVWKSRLQSLGALASRLVHLHSLAALEAFCREYPSAPVLYLCDFEFRGSAEDGLGAIERLGIAASSILVTSRADEVAVRERCVNLRIGLLPKSAAALVPIELDEQPATPGPT